MFKNIKHIAFATLAFILLLITNIIIIFNSKFLFKYFAMQNNLAQNVSLSLEEILNDYEKIIVYIRNPLVYNLNFDNFTLSDKGAIHFFEVKVIFMYLCVSAFLIALFFAIYILYKRFFYQKTILRSRMKKNLKICSRYLSKISLIFTLALSAFIFIDFTKVFNFMHTLLFHNDYWIFNSTSDSIITILPENFFMICALVILCMLLIEVFAINLYTKKDVDI